VSLKHLPSVEKQPDSVYNNETVPWQRVINAKGTISQRYGKHSSVPVPFHWLSASRGANGASRQAEALRQEGVTVERSSMGEHSIDFALYGWFPIMLPSEEAELEESDSDSGSESG